MEGAYLENAKTHLHTQSVITEAFPIAQVSLLTKPEIAATSSANPISCRRIFSRRETAN